MDAVFYSVSSDKRCLSKILNNKIATLDIRLKDKTDLLNPKMELKVFSGWEKANYCYIPKLNRYYFINDINLGNANVLNMGCHVDVLMSYKNEIKKLNCLIERNEFLFNGKIIDNELLVKTNRNISNKQLGSLPSISGGVFALTVMGGNV